MSILSTIMWYLTIGIVVSALDILNEKRKDSNAYNNVIVGIGDNGSVAVFVFILILSVLWPLILGIDIYRGIRG